MKKKVISDVERLQQFFHYCKDLEENPFFIAHKHGGQHSITYKFKVGEEEKLNSSYDKHHLESFLIRLRQFVLKKELFSYRDMEKSTKALFGDSEMINDFFNGLEVILNKKLTGSGLKINVQGTTDLFGSNSIIDFLESSLYSGQIHSERRITSEKGSLINSMVNSHPMLAKIIELEVSSIALNIYENIRNARMVIYKSAVASNKLSLFSELQEFDIRYRKYLLSKEKGT